MEGTGALVECSGAPAFSVGFGLASGDVLEVVLREINPVKIAYRESAETLMRLLRMSLVGGSRTVAMKVQPLFLHLPAKPFSFRLPPSKANFFGLYFMWCRKRQFITPSPVLAGAGMR